MCTNARNDFSMEWNITDPRGTTFWDRNHRYFVKAHNQPTFIPGWKSPYVAISNPVSFIASGYVCQAGKFGWLAGVHRSYITSIRDAFTDRPGCTFPDLPFA